LFWHKVGGFSLYVFPWRKVLRRIVYGFMKLHMLMLQVHYVTLGCKKAAVESCFWLVPSFLRYSFFILIKNGVNKASRILWWYKLTFPKDHISMNNKLSEGSQTMQLLGLYGKISDIPKKMPARTVSLWKNHLYKFSKDTYYILYYGGSHCKHDAGSSNLL